MKKIGLVFSLVLFFSISFHISAQFDKDKVNKLAPVNFSRINSNSHYKNLNQNFFPNKTGDFWEYIEEDTTTLFSQFLNLKFSVSREVLADTLMSNGFTYKKVKWQNEANSVNYLPTFEYLRVDSIGNAHIHYNNTDFILFDFTLEVNQTYTAHLFNHYWKVLDKYDVIGFGDTLLAVDFGLYDQNSTMTEIFSIVENFGIIFYQKDLINYALPQGNFWGAVINGQEFGTLIVKKQTVDWKEFYPLHIGDYWVYEGFDGSIPITNSVRVIGDTIMPDNNSYFVLKEIDHTFGYTSLSFRRLDSLGRVFYWEAWNDTVKQYFEFSNSVGDTLKAFSMNILFRLNDKYISSYPEVVELNNYIYPDLAYIQNDYDKGLGLYRTTGDFYLLECSGAYINGEIIYGDTTLTSIWNDLTPFLNEYHLSQNYPNPFNPSTKISWQAPISCWQTLKVYDILGNEVAALVDEFRNAGSYNEQFTINNVQLSSGVYFYQLRVGDYLETKKMILLK